MGLFEVMACRMSFCRGYFQVPIQVGESGLYTMGHIYEQCASCALRIDCVRRAVRTAANGAMSISGGKLYSNGVGAIDLGLCCDVVDALVEAIGVLVCSAGAEAVVTDAG